MHPRFINPIAYLRLARRNKITIPSKYLIDLKSTPNSPTFMMLTKPIIYDLIEKGKLTFLEVVEPGPLDSIPNLLSKGVRLLMDTKTIDAREAIKLHPDLAVLLDNEYFASLIEHEHLSWKDIQKLNALNNPSLYQLLLDKKLDFHEALELRTDSLRYETYMNPRIHNELPFKQFLIQYDNVQKTDTMNPTVLGSCLSLNKRAETSNRYRGGMLDNFQDYLQEIEHYILERCNQNHEDPAYLAFNILKDPNNRSVYELNEASTSPINMKKLLVLAWLAATDKENVKIHPDDAKIQFVEALRSLYLAAPNYEKVFLLQSSNAFNLFVEKLVGIDFAFQISKTNGLASPPFNKTKDLVDRIKTEINTTEWKTLNRNKQPDTMIEMLACIDKADKMKISYDQALKEIQRLGAKANQKSDPLKTWTLGLLHNRQKTTRAFYAKFAANGPYAAPALPEDKTHRASISSRRKGG